MSTISSLTNSPYSTGLSGNATGLTSGTSQTPALTSYTQTGIQSANGSGYAYPPGSDMCQFMDNINNTTAQACLSPDGTESVMTWANNLAQQAAATSASAGTSTGATPSGSSMTQMLSTLMTMLESMMGGSTGASTATGSYDMTSSTPSLTNSITNGIYSYYNS